MQDDAMVVDEQFATALGRFAKCHNAGQGYELRGDRGASYVYQDTINT